MGERYDFCGVKGNGMAEPTVLLISDTIRRFIHMSDARRNIQDVSPSSSFVS